MLDFLSIGLVSCLLWAAHGALTSFTGILGKRTGFVFGVLIAVMFARHVSPLLHTAFSTSDFVGILISYILLYTATYIIVTALSKALGGLLEAMYLGPLDSFLGFFVGLCESIIFWLFLLYLLNLQTVFDVSGYIQESFFFQRISEPLMKVLFS